MSITGNIYNIDQTLTGEGVTDLELNTLLVDGLFQNVNATFFKNINSNIQDQLDTLSSITPITGNSATIAIGTTTTLSSGSNVSVTNTGTTSDAILNFGIPRGIQGITPTIEIGSVTTGSTANVTIDNNILTNPKLNFTLVNGTNGITPTLQIGSVTNLDAGSTPTATLTPSILYPNNYTLNFGLVKGNKGDLGNKGDPGNNGDPGNDGITPTFSINPTIDNLASGQTPTITLTDDPTIANRKVFKFGLVRGAKGDKGDPGSDGDSSAATTAAVASAASSTAALASAAASATSAGAAATSAGAAAASAASAEESATSAISKVRHFTASDLPAKETLNGELVIKDTAGISSVISLNQSGDISTSNSISVIPTGSNKNAFIATSDGNLLTTGRISLDKGKIITTSTTTSIISDTINIGGTSNPSTINIGVGVGLDVTTNNTINIGNVASTINLYGNVNGFIKQETTGTRYVTTTPFTAW